MSVGKTTTRNSWHQKVNGEGGSNGNRDWGTVVNNPRTAAALTLKETTENSVKLQESYVLQEKMLKIELDDSLCEIRKDTQLVVVC